MLLPAPKARWLADDLDALPSDGNRYEVIDGTLFVSPPPSRWHQRACMTLAMLLIEYVESLALELLAAPIDVRASSDTQVEPDLIVLPRHFDGREANRWEPMAKLLLAVEVLSPSTARVDRTLKRQLYMARGVAEYWIVDLDARAIEVFMPGIGPARVERDQLNWQPIASQAPLMLRVSELFHSIVDD